MKPQWNVAGKGFDTLSCMQQTNANKVPTAKRIAILDTQILSVPNWRTHWSTRCPRVYRCPRRTLQCKKRQPPILPISSQYDSQSSPGQRGVQSTVLKWSKDSVGFHLFVHASMCEMQTHQFTLITQSQHIKQKPTDKYLRFANPAALFKSIGFCLPGSGSMYSKSKRADL